MIVRLHAHAQEQVADRRASEDEVIAAVTRRERFPARFR
jgi:hypothetical protein